ncbi:MAG: PEFG-CTERM sorting domain-containing protein [Nitrosopumilaceae archaeon]
MRVHHGLVLSALVVAVLTSPAFAVQASAQQQVLPLEIATDKTEYDHASVIIVTGQVKSPSQYKPVTIVVRNPIGNVVTIDQIMVDENGQFITTINTASALMKKDGTYTISAQYQSGATDEVEVTVVPEFGSIAAMVLVVAIVSIIAISAKTRLNFIPRY